MGEPLLALNIDKNLFWTINEQVAIDKSVNPNSNWIKQKVTVNSSWGLRR